MHKKGLRDQIACQYAFAPMNTGKNHYYKFYKISEARFRPKTNQREERQKSRREENRFWGFKRNGHLYTEIVSDAKNKTLLQVVRGRAAFDSVIHTDGWRAYDGLVDLGYEKHYRVQHEDDELSRKTATKSMVLSRFGPSRNCDWAALKAYQNRRFIYI